MKFFRHLYMMHAMSRALHLIDEGRVLAFDFQPMRKGRLRLVRGTSVLDIHWHRRARITSLSLDGEEIGPLSLKRHDRLLQAALKRAEHELDPHREEIDRNLPWIVPGRMQTRVSISAQRMAHAITTARIISCRLRDDSFGDIVLQTGEIVVRMHTIEKGKLPAIEINGHPAYATRNDVRHISKAIWRRRRELAGGKQTKTLQSAA